MKKTNGFLTSIILLGLACPAGAQLAIRLEGSKDVVIADKDIIGLTIAVREPSLLPADSPEFFTATFTLTSEAGKRFAEFSGVHVNQRLEMIAGKKKITSILLATAIRDGKILMDIQEPATCAFLFDAFTRTRFTKDGSPKR